MNKMLLMCREARDNMDVKRGAEKRAAEEIDDKKERVGRQLQSLATMRKSSNINDVGSKVAAEQCEGRSRKSQRIGGDSDMELSTIHIRDEDFVTIDSNGQRLAFEKKTVEVKV